MEIVDLKKDPRFEMGKALLSEGKYDDSINMFESLAREFADKYGDESVETAKAWYWYADALITKEEECADDILGDAAAEAKAAVASMVAEMQADGEEGGEAASSSSSSSTSSSSSLEAGMKPVPADIIVEPEDEGGEQQEEGGDDDEEQPEDLEIAFECLEVCRRALEANAHPDTDKDLADCRVRLGDVMKYSGKFDLAVQEYEAALEIREAVEDTSSRLLSEVFFKLAIAHVELARVEGFDTTTEKKNALKRYKQVQDIIRANIEKEEAELKGVMDAEKKEKLEKQIEEDKDLDDVLVETITAMDKEIAEGMNSSSTSSSSSSSSSSSNTQSGTTIGFGFGFGTSSSSSSSSSSNNNKGTSSSSFGSSAPAPMNVNVNTMNTMQVRKKNPNSSTNTVTTTGAENEESNAAKKARIDEDGTSIAVPEKAT